MKRADVLRQALRRGLFLETNYERILSDDALPGEFPHARWAADNVLLLPLYSSLTEQDARRIAREVAAIAAGADRGWVPISEASNPSRCPVGSREG